jgi:hypothetical protein
MLLLGGIYETSLPVYSRNPAGSWEDLQCELPSHLTLMSRFFSDLSPHQLNKVVRPLFEKTTAIRLIFGRIEELGPKKLAVHLVNHSNELDTLHNGLLTLLNSIPVEYEYPQFIGTRHKPHITAREGTDFKVGDTFIAKQACLVEVVDGQRIVRLKFAFGA